MTASLLDATLPYALQQAVFEKLNAIDELTGKIYYFAAPVNTELPYVEYWTGDGVDDAFGGFGEESREYNIYVQASSRDGLEASRMYGAAELALSYQKLVVEGWSHRGKVTFSHELDDPGDNTQDDDIIYFTGGCFSIGLYRQRTDI